MSFPSPRPGFRPGADRGRRGLYGEVVNSLGRRIVAGRLEAGAVIVPDEIAQEFRVSRTVVRESLRMLEAKGLVTARPHVGTQVRPSSDWSLIDADIIEWRLHGPRAQEQQRELQELRRSMLTTVVGIVAGKMNDEVRNDLEHDLSVMRQALANADDAAYARVDQRYHDVLVGATDNRMVEHLSNLTNATAGTPSSPTGMCAPPTSAAIDQHAVLLQALVAGDVATAEAIARALSAAAHDFTDICEGAHHG